MKKILYSLLAALVLLTACNAEEPNNNRQSANVPLTKEVKDTPIKVNDGQTTKDSEEKLNEQSQETQPREIPQPLTKAQVKEIIDFYGAGKGDQLSNFSFVNGEIKATVNLAPKKMFPAKDIAVNRYSQLSDELLKHEGWNILTITYPAVGTISMHRNEKETNDKGDYFPTMVIKEKLK
ncbi:hypothetical protein [Neobacillus sp. DY30]|uniref:hypothetical protein n=1 Tax=Neobacillus sp. DY30 TaxID=3047871 RepID=UPI0024BF943E|nr:hypothetical protein [Neobacillus sp. DY30]WHY00307.1 hypothetical protein QNH29_27910 [Neobacillus sp. DY30]